MALLWTYALHDPVFGALEKTLDDFLEDCDVDIAPAPQERHVHFAQPLQAGGQLQGGKRASASANLKRPRYVATPEPRLLTNPGRFDIVEHESEYQLITDAPGFDPSDISVEFKEGVLTISGKHEQERVQGPKQVQQAQEPATPPQAGSPSKAHEMEQAPAGATEEGKAVTAGEQQQQQQQQILVGAQQGAVTGKSVGGGKFWRRERQVHQFMRTFKLPEDAKAEDIVAQLDKGVLTVTVPKLPPAPKPQAKRIKVQGVPAQAA